MTIQSRNSPSFRPESYGRRCVCTGRTPVQPAGPRAKRLAKLGGFDETQQCRRAALLARRRVTFHQIPPSTGEANKRQSSLTGLAARVRPEASTTPTRRRTRRELLGQTESCCGASLLHGRKRAYALASTVGTAWTHACSVPLAPSSRSLGTRRVPSRSPGHRSVGARAGA